eukprot:1513402-Pleurochrysis_carterae.AAC.1
MHAPNGFAATRRRQLKGCAQPEWTPWQTTVPHHAQAEELVVLDLRCRARPRAPPPSLSLLRCCASHQLGLDLPAHRPPRWQTHVYLHKRAHANALRNPSHPPFASF